MKINVYMRILMFIVLVILTMFFIWLSGYNFDERSPAVAGWTFGIGVVEFLMAMYYNIESGKF